MGIFINPTAFLQKYDLSYYILIALVLLVGIGIGSNPRNILVLKDKPFTAVIIVLSAITGTLAGAGLISIFIREYSFRECLAVGSGFGYYSLSSLIITKIHSESLGVVALLSNIFREILTLVFAPLIVRYIGKIALITSGGATSMDTTLSVITRYAGKSYGIFSVFNGVTLTILVPVLIELILS